MVERGSGAVLRGGRRKRGRSQSQSSSSSSEGEEEDLPPREDAPKRVCTGGPREREEGETDSEGEGEYTTWMREEMIQLEEQGEWDQTWGEHMERNKRRREWEREGWEQWEVREEAAKVIGGGGGMERDKGSVIDGEMEGVEGEKGVEGNNVDVKGGGGKMELVNLTGSNQAPGRKPLVGRRRGVKERKAKEAEKMALHMKQWLGSGPPRS